MKTKLLAPVLAAALACGLAAAPAGATPDRAEVQQSLDSLVRKEKFPAALAAVQAKGRSTSYTSGTGELGKSTPVPRDGQVRVGSNTKTFVAVVVLQLVGEGKVELDAPIERYLPGLVRGQGIDGRAITVRQLLQHTSGLPNYTAYIGLEKFENVQHVYVQPRELLDRALAHPADFAPGAKWEYSNTNYLLAGLLIERVTGRPVAEQVTERVIDRIGLRDTYWPEVGDQTIDGRHPHGYVLADDVSDRVVDATELDPSWGWAAGAMISTPSDLNRFFSALLGGRLLGAAQLAQMRTTVEAATWPGARYGLGLVSTPLSCGGVYWGHGGDIHGFETRGGVTEDGRGAAVAVTALPGTFDKGNAERAALAVLSTVDTALCTSR
ncbi:beta-lactamase family protein [Lentzea tibetensis]|uniref:Beta-lactamase family protein n=1 Tax=Lentzea tibetensis TaxID=2591470 RepID=A0A563ELC8_9PSEU|nr:serine hydrolase domain-containing protein [Lentzea tibetensis]TWP47797.1 beta-lactamase family protein [Lentzea tibetensis]